MNLTETPRIQNWNPKKVAFGRHEKFHLRFGWLTKGFQAIKKNPKIFQSDEATVTLGVGKNMVSSIRYWLQAAKIVEKTENGYIPTEIGDAIFSTDGFDPFLEDEGTIWLIHWQLCTNPYIATSWYWFFNYFHKSEFSSQEATNALISFIKENVNAKYSLTTLKSDISLLLRMYTKSKGSTRTPIEDALDSPMSLLSLISYSSSSKLYSSHVGLHKSLNVDVIGFALSELMDRLSISTMPIRDLMYGSYGVIAPGAIFRLSESGMLAKLEKLTEKYPDTFEIRETAGIHQLYRLKSIDSVEFLEKSYLHGKRAASNE